MAARLPSTSIATGFRWAGPGPLLQVMGHLAAWVGLYAGACVAVANLLLEGSVVPSAVAIAASTAMATYLIDRARPVPGAMDPADAMAHASRAALMVRHGPAIRLSAILLLVMAAGLAMVTCPWAIVAVLAAPLGVLLYSHRGSRRRPKDRLIIKNACVSVCMVAMVLLLVARQGMGLGILLVGIFLLLHVFVDAMLCDIDDRDADAEFGTRTIPNTMGVPATWAWAVGLNVLALAVVLLAGWLALLPLVPSLVLGLSTLAATLIVALCPVARVKDLVDLKMPVAVLLGWAVLSVSGGVPT